MLKKSHLLTILAIVLGIVLQAQDTLQAPLVDSLKITEKLLMLEQNQKQIDSLLKVQLQQKLRDTVSLAQKDSIEKKLKELIATDSVRINAQKQRIEILKAANENFPVTPFRDSIFSIHTGLGSFSAKERAQNAEERIKQLYDRYTHIDSLSIVEFDEVSNIVSNSNYIITSVTELDAMWYEVSRKELAQQYLHAIIKEIENEREVNSFSNQLMRSGWVALIVFAFILAVLGVNWIFRKSGHYLLRKRAVFFKGISIKSYRLFTQAQHASLVIRFHHIVRIVVIVLAAYLSLLLIFNIFPQTREYTQTLLHWIISPAKKIVHSFLAFLPDLITMIVVFVFTRYLIKLVRYFTTQVEKENLVLPGFHKDFARPTFGIVRFLLYIFMLIIIFPYLPGSGSPAFSGISVFLGVLISFGSSSSISNMIAGLVISYMRPFKVGDRVKIGETLGDVVEKTLLVTKIRTIKNEEVTIPNSNILSSNPVNYSTNAETKGLILHTNVTVSYDVSYKTNEQLLLKAALLTNHIEHIPVPFVLHIQLNEFYATYQLNAYTKNVNEFEYIYSDLHKNIQTLYAEAGIELLSPHFNTIRQKNN